MDIWPMHGLRYGTDPQADAQPGDQVADTDGLALSRLGAIQNRAAIAQLKAGDPQTVTFALPGGGSVSGQMRIEEGCDPSSRISMKISFDWSIQPPATAKPLPDQALKPLPRVGGLFCPF